MQLFTETTEAFNLPTAGCIPCCRNCTQSTGRTALCYTHKYHLYRPGKFYHHEPAYMSFVLFTRWILASTHLSTISHWLLVKILRPTRHKIGHFGHVPQANLWAWYGKTKPNTTKAHIHQSKEMYNNTNKKLKPGLVASYDIGPGNGEGLFCFWHFINLSLTYLLRHLPTYLQVWDPHGEYKSPQVSYAVLNKCSSVSTN